LNIAGKSHREVLKGSIELEVQIILFRDEGGNDRVRAEASLSNGKANFIVGGADIVPYPPNPLVAVIPHATEFISKRHVLSVSSALIGAIGPMIGGCLGAEGEQGRFRVRNCITSKMDEMLKVAFAAALGQLEGIRDFE
jgi:hypothetical protein